MVAAALLSHACRVLVPARRQAAHAGWRTSADPACWVMRKWPRKGLHGQLLQLPVCLGGPLNSLRAVWLLHGLWVRLPIVVIDYYHYGQVMEDLEQLKVLENGHRIKVIVVDHKAHGVDEPQDVPVIEAKMRALGLS